MAKCRVCGITGNHKKITKHHLVQRARMRQLVEETGHIVKGMTIRLCESCHRSFHSPNLIKRRKIRRFIRDNLTAEEKRYIIETAGMKYYVRKYTRCL